MIWLALAEVVDDAAWQALQQARLSASERARLQRIARPLRRQQLIAAHVLVRRLIARHHAVSVEHVCVEVDSDGRPRIRVPADWQISLSHSGRWVAALAQRGGRAIGVDIESMRTERDIAALVEAADGARIPDPVQAYRRWAAAEALLKAGGHTGPCWDAIWQGHALAVCAEAVPAVLHFDLFAQHAPRSIDLAWCAHAPLGAHPASLVDAG